MSDHDTWNMFAAAAMQGMLASPHLADHIKNVGSPPTTMDTYDYVAIAARAYADALLAESKKRELAEPSSTTVKMSFHPTPTPPQPDDDGWIKWEGGECPVPPTTRVMARLRDGEVSEKAYPGQTWDWEHTNSAFDILAYRVSEAGVTK